MGDLTDYGLGDIASQWGGAAPANDYPLITPSTPQPSANEQRSRAERLGDLTDAELHELHSQTMQRHMDTVFRYQNLRQMRADAAKPKPGSYEEALGQQQGLTDENLRAHESAIGKGVAHLQAQREALGSRGLTSPWEYWLNQGVHIPPPPPPDDGIEVDEHGNEIEPSEPSPAKSGTPDEQARQEEARYPMAEPTLGGGNPMSPLSRGPQMPRWQPEQPSSLPRELTFGRAANENEPPVE